MLTILPGYKTNYQNKLHSYIIRKHKFLKAPIYNSNINYKIPLGLEESNNNDLTPPSGIGNNWKIRKSRRGPSKHQYRPNQSQGLRLGNI